MGATTEQWKIAYAKFWRELSFAGDPDRIPNKILAGYKRGWEDALASHAPSDKNAEGLIWAVERWNLEVRNRPIRNVHYRTLDETWRQVIRYFGGDPDELVGPPPQYSAPREAAAHKCDWSDKLRAWKCRCGFISRIGAEVCAHQTEMGKL